MWHDFLAAALLVILGGWAISRLVGRFSSRRSSELALAAGLVGRIAVVAVMVYSTEQSVNRGGWFIALAALFVLVGVGSVFTGAISAAALWFSVTGRLRE
jgi:hypothetical protein